MNKPPRSYDIPAIRNVLRLRRRSRSKATAWVAAEALLLCLLWINVLASDSGKSFRGAATISSPQAAACLKAIHEFKGVAFAPADSDAKMEVRLRHIATGKVWDWSAECWSEDAHVSAPLKQGTRLPWMILAPKLAEGRYQLECSVRKSGIAEKAAVTFFSIDRTAPRISFFPLHDQSTLEDDLSEIGGEIDEAADIRFSICRFTETGSLSWNGNDWQKTTNDEPLLAAAMSYGFWFPAAGTVLPKASQLPAGSYLIFASAVDRAGNEGRAAITIQKRSAQLALRTPR